MTSTTVANVPGSVSNPDEIAPSFMVVALMREDPPIINRFVEFYLKCGADSIVIYFDGILTERSNVLRLDHPRVQFIECTSDFWKESIVEKPESLEDTQLTVYNIAYAHCRCDWMLMVDSDEFVVGPCSIRTLLASVPEGVDSLRVRTAEAIWGPGDDLSVEFGSSYFRTALPRRGAWLLARLLYGKYASLFRLGMLGHTSGKHFLRRTARFDQIGVHFSKLKGEAIGEWVQELSPNRYQFMVTHFDAISFDRWREKWRRRIENETIAKRMSNQRISQMRIIREAMAIDEDSLRKVFHIFYSITRWQFLILAPLEKVVRVEVFDKSAPDSSVPS